MNEWMASVAALLDESQNPKGYCEVGHERHDRIEVPILNGTDTMVIFDREQYTQFSDRGYCPGNDDVSRTLALYGIWEEPDYVVFRLALVHNPGEVIDFGSQIGWYTKAALREGRHVLAIEGVAEHAQMTWLNAEPHWDRLHQAIRWVEAPMPVLPAEGAPPIAFVKIDLEGADLQAVLSLSELIEAGNVATILCEISPVFNGTYHNLLHLLFDYGYAAAVTSPWRPFTQDEIADVLSTYPQVDVIFARNPWWL